jgi:hypothetical protein
MSATNSQGTEDWFRSNVGDPDMDRKRNDANAAPQGATAQGTSPKGTPTAELPAAAASPCVVGAPDVMCKHHDGCIDSKDCKSRGFCISPYGRQAPGFWP